MSRTILGYADRFSVAPGEKIAFKASCHGHAHYHLEIVRPLKTYSPFHGVPSASTPGGPARSVVPAYASPRRAATATAWARVSTPSLLKTDLTW